MGIVSRTLPEPTLFYDLVDQLDELLDAVAKANNEGLVSPGEIKESLDRFITKLRCGWCRGSGLFRQNDIWVCPHCHGYGIPSEFGGRES